LFEGVLGDNVVLGTEAFVLLGLRHVVIIGPFKEVIGV
jgi:hypothetical protein